MTFAGTLTLISAIENGLVDGEPRPGVRIVVNRIPTRYRWKDLEEIYTGVAADFIGISEALPGVSYIPVEGELFVTFGEYPYQVDLAPNSLFAQKLRLLLFQIVPDTPLEILKKNHSPKKQRRVHEALSTSRGKSHPYRIRQFRSVGDSRTGNAAARCRSDGQERGRLFGFHRGGSRTCRVWCTFGSFFLVRNGATGPLLRAVHDVPRSVCAPEFAAKSIARRTRDALCGLRSSFDHGRMRSVLVGYRLFNRRRRLQADA